MKTNLREHIDGLVHKNDALLDCLQEKLTNQADDAANDAVKEYLEAFLLDIETLKVVAQEYLDLAINNAKAT